MTNKINTKKILAIIPARGGSKGIPDKNIVVLGNHPLLSYSIGVAKLSKFINRIIVTTDNKKYAEISRKYGAEVPFLRPKKYSRDLSPDIEFFEHALNWLEKKEGYVPNLVIHLRPTTPDRNYKIIDKAILEILADKEATALRSAHISEYTGYKIFRKKGAYVNFFGKEDFKKNEEFYNYPRQTLTTTYRPNDYVDIILSKTLKKTGTLHGKKIRIFITKRVIDINSIKDLEFAKKSLKNKEYLPLINLLNEIKK